MHLGERGMGTDGIARPASPNLALPYVSPTPLASRSPLEATDNTPEGLRAGLSRTGRVGAGIFRRLAKATAAQRA